MHRFLQNNYFSREEKKKDKNKKIKQRRKRRKNFHANVENRVILKPIHVRRG